MLKKAVVLIAAVCLFCGLSGCASVKKTAETETAAKSAYTAPKVEDTPYFIILKTSLEADGFSYTHYETGTGLVLWGVKNGENRGYGSKDEGIIRIPNDDVEKAYFVSWDQYFSAFSQMHKACFENENVREIKKAVDKLVLEADYDYSRIYGLPDDAKWIFHRDTKIMALNDEYVNLVIERTAGLKGIKEGAKIFSPAGEHSWNEILLEDGRIIYIDSVWYDTNGFYLDSGNYMVDHIPQYMPVMFTFDRDLFNIGGTHYSWGDVTRTAVPYKTAQAPKKTAPAKSAAVKEPAKASGKPERQKKSAGETKEKIGNPFEFVGTIGAYGNGWHENLVSVGIPLQLGAEINFAKMAFALLAEGGAGLGLPSVEEWKSPVVEWYYGGLAEFYLPGQRFGLGFGYFFLNTYDLIEKAGPSRDPFETSYMRFSLMHRNKSKQTIYGQLHENGDWGIGIIFSSGFLGRAK